MIHTGFLDKLPLLNRLSDKTQALLLRAIRAGLSVALGIILTAVTSGYIFPPEYDPIKILVITAILQAVDKYLRDSADENTTP